MWQQRDEPIRVGSCLDASDLTIPFHSQEVVERADRRVCPIRREIAVKDLIEKLMLTRQTVPLRDLLPLYPR
jgi:hypothetical protein